MLFANVSVNTPLGPRPDPDASVDPFGRVFTYRVPEALAGRVEPGHLVWCLFRGRRVQAIVLNLTDAAPPFAVQPIQGLVWAQPLLTPTQLTLAQWISRAYLAPLIECLRLMLPAGLTQRG
jgi:primosomal protein N' (replication factor Y)